MNPITITWPPILYTDYGKENFKNWLAVGGFDNLTINYNPEVLRRLTKLSLKIYYTISNFYYGSKTCCSKYI